MRKIEIYTDGSHLKHDENAVSYGICVVEKGKEKATASGLLDVVAFKNLYGVPPSNPTAELYAAAFALRQCIRCQEMEISIYADFIGVKEWSTNKWKAKKPYIKDIQKNIFKSLETLKNRGVAVDFIWIKGHSGVEFNERADKLCRQLKHNTIPNFLYDEHLNQIP